jgi:hypothetical protein
MITQTKTETMAADGWTAVDETQFRSQRSGGGILTLLLFPMIALAALLYAAAELAK